MDHSIAKDDIIQKITIEGDASELMQKLEEKLSKASDPRQKFPKKNAD
ncbi:MAG: hypothetical protein ABI575_06005 [Oxalobacteraceae bacterium]